MSTEHDDTRRIRPTARTEIDRRQFLGAAAVGLGGPRVLGALGKGAGQDPAAPEGVGPAPRGSSEAGLARLDRLLVAHADVLPEWPGTGANHYPMAAEALEALGFEDEIDPTWSTRGAGLYRAAPARSAPLEEEALDGGALGADGRYGDWLDWFRGRIESQGWRATLAAAVPRLAPGLAAAAFHGVIRTGHAVRALGRQENAARRGELAVGLAYWAACYAELPSRPDSPFEALDAGKLAELEHPFQGSPEDVGFFDVVPRLSEKPLAPPLRQRGPGEVGQSGLTAVRADLRRIVHAATLAFIEMLAQEQHRIWLLHCITAPACVDLLLPHVDPRDGRLLVDHVERAIFAMYAAFGVPFEPGEHVREAPGPWSDLLPAAAVTGSVHTIKLAEALSRFDTGRSTVARTALETWLEWK